MTRILTIALKDLKILFRDKAGAFFIVVFPILMGLFFGLMMGGNSSSDSGSISIAIVDQDQSEMSGKFIERLNANESLALDVQEDFETAKQNVRKGKLVGVIMIPKGYGEKAGVFWEQAPAIELGMDPSRSAESGMIQGFIMEASGGLMGERFGNPDEFRSVIDDSLSEVEANEDLNPVTRTLLKSVYGSMDSMIESLSELQSETDGDGEGGGEETGVGGFQLANVNSFDITRELDPGSVGGQMSKMKSRWDISFPQAMMWGVMGCVAGFAISIARERTLGTMLRLQVAPLSRFQILAGKAMACFLAVMGVIAMLTVLGVCLGMSPGNYLHLIIAATCVAFCFVGIMMTMSVLGKTEQSVSGSGWAINMVMAMFGGCMIPVMFMPKFIQTYSVLSPIKWGILAIEGAVWRDFSLQEMVWPCVILVVIGCVGLAVGTTILSRREN